MMMTRTTTSAKTTKRKKDSSCISRILVIFLVITTLILGAIRYVDAFSSISTTTRTTTTRVVRRFRDNSINSERQNTIHPFSNSALYTIGRWDDNNNREQRRKTTANKMHNFKDWITTSLLRRNNSRKNINRSTVTMKAIRSSSSTERLLGARGPKRRFIRMNKTALDTIRTRRALEGFGSPSKPGWQSARLDRLTDWVAETESNRPIICEYNPNSFWLWTRWRGTVLQITLKSILLTMSIGLLVDYWAHSVSTTTWNILSVPPSSDPLIKSLEGLRKLWEYQFTLCTFILTFFTSQSYTYWQKVYDCCRAIQGRINDICMLVTIGAKRQKTTTANTVSSSLSVVGGVIPKSANGTPGSSATSNSNSNDNNMLQGYTKKGETLVKKITRLIRVSHTFFWAATPTFANGLDDCNEFLKDAANCPLPIDDAHIGPLLLSPYGIKALINTGQLTKDEADSLIRTRLPPSQYAYVLLTWVGLYAKNGLKDGTLRCDNGFEENLLRQLTSLRSEMFNIDDYRAGRMSLAYVQLVQVLVDSLVFLAPFALYPELGSLSIPVTGLLTLFFRGLLELSKSFLDPFGVEGYRDQNLRVDVLVSELNFGASTRWIKAAESLPMDLKGEIGLSTSAS